MSGIEKYPENIKFREVSHTIEGLVYMCFYADRSHAHKRTTCVLDNSEIIFPAIGNFLKGELLIPTKTTLRPMAKYISNQAVS